MEDEDDKPHLTEQDMAALIHNAVQQQERDRKRNRHKPRSEDGAYGIARGVDFDPFRG